MDQLCARGWTSSRCLRSKLLPTRISHQCLAPWASLFRFGSCDGQGERTQVVCLFFYRLCRDSKDRIHLCLQFFPSYFFFLLNQPPLRCVLQPFPAIRPLATDPSLTTPFGIGSNGFYWFWRCFKTGAEAPVVTAPGTLRLWVLCTITRPHVPRVAQWVGSMGC